MRGCDDDRANPTLDKPRSRGVESRTQFKSKEDLMSATSIRDPLLLAKSAAVERFLKTAKPRPTFTASIASARPEHNVVGVGVGSKLVEGRSTDQKCVRFYVERKVNKDAIPPDYVLPERIADIETDVIETGRFRACQLAVVAPQRARDPRTKMRPAHPAL